ncbi:MAG: tRNA 4-thiouridine(8) synthase ThiI [Defluviitaleaceae bacterium]|nr:tRNA 4-thiouridine(8) synthase ThiI [Defluviitaleaceae bacterium]
MDTTKVLLVKYGEIALRGKNRRMFQKQLTRDLQRRLEELGGYRIVLEDGRFVIERSGSASGEMEYESVLSCVRTTLGIVGFCPCTRTRELSLENIIRLVLDYIRDNYNDFACSFKVETKRANKLFPVRSYDVSAAVGEAVLNSFPPSRVDVHNPDVVLNIEIRHSAYIYSKVVPGLGGLPAGSSGRGVLLLSGGIDSPVAGFMMAKRGLALEAVYFNSPPFTSERALQKVLDIAHKIAGYSGYIKLHVVPFTDIQTYLYESVPREKLTIFMKRAMLKIAGILADRCEAKCVVTGDSLGQVASQTIEAISAIDASCSITILRPLAGLDKHEIISIAQKIGTYEISVRPFEDCCTIFVAKHPEIRPKVHIIERMEAKLEFLPEKVRAAADAAYAHVFLYGSSRAEL